MKKINWKQILIPPLLFLIILALSGCARDTETYPDCENWLLGVCQDEYDYQDCVDDGGVIIYSNVTTTKQCMILDTYTQEEVDEMLNDLVISTGETFDNYYAIIDSQQSHIEELEQRIEELEQERDMKLITDYLLTILLNPNDDYEFTYKNGVLTETQISTGDIETFNLDDIVEQFLDEVE